MKGKVLLRVIGIIAVVFVIVFIGACTTLWIMFPPEKIKALVIPEVEKALGRNVEVAKAKISVFPVLGISLNGIEISNTLRPDFSDAPFVKLDRFLVQISVMSIFKGYPEISQIILDKPAIRIEISPEGKYNFDDLALLAADSSKKEKKSGPLSLPVPLTLKKFKIQNGTITYVDKKGMQEIVLGDVNDQTLLSLDKQLRNIQTNGTLVMSNVSLKTKDFTKPLSNLTITLTHDITANLIDGTVDIKQLRVSLQKVFLNLTGKISNLNATPDLDLVINSDPIAIKDLLSEIPPEISPEIKKLTANGFAELGLVIKGSLKDSSSLPIKGTLKLKDVMVKYTSLPKSINDLNADLAFTDKSLTINNFDLNFGTNPISLKGTVVNFSKPVVDVALAAKINLGDLQEMVELPDNSSLLGIMTADISAKGEADPSDPTKLDLKGTVDFKELKVLWSPLAKPAFINGTFTLSSKAIGQNLSAHVGNSSLTLSTTISNYLSLILTDTTKHYPRPYIDLKVASPYLNVDEIMLTKEEKVSTQNQTASTEDAPLIAPLPGIDIKGDIRAQKMIYKGVEMSNMTLLLSVINDIADINLKSGFGGGFISNALHGDLRNVNNVAFTNKLTVDKVEVNSLMSRFGNFIQPTTPLNRELRNIQNCLFGKVSISSSISGNGRNIDAIMNNLLGNLSLKMNEGQIINTPLTTSVSSAASSLLKTNKLGNFNAIQFRDLSALINIANGKALFDNMKIASEQGDFDVKGAIGFDASMAMVVANKLTSSVSSNLTSAESSLKGFAKDGLKNTRFAAAGQLLDNIDVIPRDKDGRVTVKFGLEGTVSKPRVTSIAFGEGTTQAPQQSAKQQLTNQVQQELESKKLQLQQQLDAQRQQVQSELQSKLDAQKKALEDQNKQQANQLKQNAVNKLKKIF